MVNGSSQNGSEENSGEEQEEDLSVPGDNSGDVDEDEENEEGEGEGEGEGEEAEEDQTPEQGPLIDSALIPTQAMLASANPYLNPMHPLHPFKHEFNVQHHYQTPHGMVTYSNGSAASGPAQGASGGGMDLSDADMAHFDQLMGVPSHYYPDKCLSVQKKAMSMANKLMKEYNKRIFRKIMNYLLKSKFLIGMTEIKLNHIMRKKIYNVMSSFSRVSKDNIEFVESSQEPVLSDDDDSIDSDVQSIDFSNMSEDGPDKGTAGEMYGMLNDQMDTQGNVHIND